MRVQSETAGPSGPRRLPGEAAHVTAGPRATMSKALQEKLRHVLQNTVGSIVELPESALSVAVLSGKASLGPGLKIKKDVFEQLGMPVVLNAGSIESIEIDIPTTALRSKPVVVRIKDVLISLSPNPEVNTRRAKLAEQERLWQQAAEEGEGVDPESAMGKMVQKIVDNIHIIAENVHVRLEDTHTQSEMYAMGLVLDRFSLRSYVVNSTGADWAETCVKPVQRFLNKCLVFGDGSALQGESGLGIYLQPGEAPLADPGSVAWRATMLSYIMRQKRDHQAARPISWVVGPSVMRTRISIDKQESFDGCFSRCWNATEGAKQEIQLLIARLPIKLRNTALRNLYGLLFFYQNVSRWQRFVQSRPTCPVLGNAREWWQFAIKCELAEINRKTISVKALSKVTQEGQEYVAMYSRKAGEERPWLAPLDEEESARVQEFEDRYPADVTKTFRIRAWRLLLDGDKERQAQIQDERDVQNALLAAPSGRWGRTDLHSNFEVEYAGMISHEVSGASARKKGKECFAVVVSLKDGRIPPVREGWLQRRTHKDGAKWEKRYFVLTADEFYHSSKATGAKKSRIPLSTCQIPEQRKRGFEFELKAKDAAFILRCEDDTSRQAWLKDIADTITKRSTVETIVFDPTKHLAEAKLDNTSFTLHVKMEAATAKSSFRKKKPAMDDVLLHLTPDAFMICSFQPISDEAAEELADTQKVRLGDELATHLVTTRFTFKRLRTWSLEQNSACCKVEVTQAAGNLTALRFFSSSVCTAEEVMEAIQQCIAAVIAKQKQAKERRAQIKTQIQTLFEQYDPEKLAELDGLMKSHPGQKAEALLEHLRAQYSVDSAGPNLSPAADASDVTDSAGSDVRVTFDEEGPLGISFGSDSDDTMGWINAIRPNGLASQFAQLKNGMLLVAVQDQPVSTYQQAVDAIKVAGRPLHLTFRNAPGTAMPRKNEETLPGAAQEAHSANDESPAEVDAPGAGNPSVETITDAATSETTGHEKGRAITESRWLLRYATGSDDGAVEAIHLSTYTSHGPLKPRKEYVYETALTVKHLDGVFHRFTIASADDKKGIKLGQILESGASKAIDEASTPTVTPAQEELLDTMDVLQSFSFFASSYTEPEFDDDDTPRASLRESRRLSPQEKESKSETTQLAGTLLSKVMYDTITHACVHVDQVDIDFSMASYDVCKLKATGVSADVMHNLYGAKRLSLAIGDATLVDLYSRDSVFDTLLAAVESSGSCSENLDDDGWQILDSANKLARAPNSSDSSKGRRLSTEDATIEAPSPTTGNLEDFWTISQPVPDPMLWCEYEQPGDASVQLGEASYAARTVLKLKPVRIVANCALLPVLQDFLKLQDFKVMQAATTKALGRIETLRKKHEAARIMKADRFFDISISGPELILPESLETAEDETSVLVCTAAEFSYKTDAAEGDNVAKTENSTRTASISALQSFVCPRTVWLQAAAAQAERATAMPLWVWLEPDHDTAALTPNPFSADMCAKLEAAVRAGANTCENTDEVTGVSVVRFKPVSTSDESSILPELGQATKIVTKASSKSEIQYQVYRDVAAGRDSRPVVVEQFFNDFRAHKESQEMQMFRENGILLPFSGTARIKRTEDRTGSATEGTGFEIECDADKLQLQLSGKTMKEFLVVLLHAVEAASVHNVSLARVVKTALYGNEQWPWKRKRSSQVEATGSSSTSAFGSILQKLVPSHKLSKLRRGTSGLAEALRPGVGASTVDNSADQSGADPTATIGDDRASLLLSAKLKLGRVDLTLKGEPRGSDSSVDALTLGMRAHGVDTGLVVTTTKVVRHFAIEGVEVMHSQDGTAGAQDEYNFAAWPRAGVSVVRPEIDAQQQEGAKALTEIYTTGETGKRVEFHGAKDFMSIIDAKEIARVLPMAGTVISESERLVAMLKPMAARVGLETKIPGVPAKYSALVRDLTEMTAAATDDMEALVADQSAAVAEMRATLRTLVDQQVARYSALAEGVGNRFNKDSRAGQMGSTVAELAAGAISGEADGFEKSTADLRAQLGSLAGEKIAALAVELDQDTGKSSSGNQNDRMKAKISKAVLGGAQQLADASLSPDGLDTVQVRKVIREQSAALEAEIKEEMETQLAQRLANVQLDHLGDAALSPVLQKENVRLTAQLEKLAQQNERLVAELAALQAERVEK